MKAQKKTRKQYTKLDMKRANLIRKEYWLRKFPQSHIAKKYGLDQSTISLVVNFKSWMT